MKTNKKLELLTFLENIPAAPDVAPMPMVTVEDPFIKIPKIIGEYARAVDVKPHLEKDGKIHIQNYLSLLEHLGITFYKPVLYRTIDPNEVNQNRLKKN